MAEKYYRGEEGFDKAEDDLFKIRMDAIKAMPEGEARDKAIRQLSQDYEGKRGIIADELVLATEKATMAGPKGRTAGGIYVAADPLEHIGTGLMRAMGIRDQKRLSEETRLLAEDYGGGIESMFRSYADQPQEPAGRLALSLAKERGQGPSLDIPAMDTQAIAQPQQQQQAIMQPQPETQPQPQISPQPRQQPIGPALIPTQEQPGAGQFRGRGASGGWGEPKMPEVWQGRGRGYGQVPSKQSQVATALRGGSPDRAIPPEEEEENWWKDLWRNRTTGYGPNAWR